MSFQGAALIISLRILLFSIDSIDIMYTELTTLKILKQSLRAWRKSDLRPLFIFEIVSDLMRKLRIRFQFITWIIKFLSIRCFKAGPIQGFQYFRRTTSPDGFSKLLYQWLRLDINFRLDELNDWYTLKTVPYMKNVGLRVAGVYRYIVHAHERLHAG